MDSNALSRKKMTEGSVSRSRRAARILSKKRISSLEITCFTRGLTVTLSLPARADKVFVEGPLGIRSVVRRSAVVGFWGIVGWTPSTASQCATHTLLVRRNKITRGGRP